MLPQSKCTQLNITLKKFLIYLVGFGISFSFFFLENYSNDADNLKGPFCVCLHAQKRHIVFRVSLDFFFFFFNSYTQQVRQQYFFLFFFMKFIFLGSSKRPNRTIFLVIFSTLVGSLYLQLISLPTYSLYLHSNVFLF